MEADTTPLCVNINHYWRRRRYRRLKGVVIGDNGETVKVSMCQKTKTPKRFRETETIPKRFRDAYEEIMLCFAGHVAQLNNGINFYLLKSSETEVQQLGD